MGKIILRQTGKSTPCRKITTPALLRPLPVGKTATPPHRELLFSCLRAARDHARHARRQEAKTFVLGKGRPPPKSRKTGEARETRGEAGRQRRTCCKGCRRARQKARKVGHKARLRKHMPLRRMPQSKTPQRQDKSLASWLWSGMVQPPSP